MLLYNIYSIIYVLYSKTYIIPICIHSKLRTIHSREWKITYFSSVSIIFPYMYFLVFKYTYINILKIAVKSFLGNYLQTL